MLLKEDPTNLVLELLQPLGVQTELANKLAELPSSTKVHQGA